MSKHQVTRRAFLAATTTSAVIAATARKYKVNAAEVVPGKKSPNEKLNVAGIGVGGMGKGDIFNCMSENVVALCDVDWKQAEEAFVRMPDAKQYKDYRKMLEEMGDEIDACTVSTPDHTHAPAAYMAMKMGKHVRVQKPLTHTIAEARLLAKTAKEMKVVTQMGNQGHAGHGVREMCEMLWSGAIGDVTEAHIWTNRPIWPQGIDRKMRAEEPPETMAWDLWIGSAPFREYNKAYAPFKWRGWWDFGCGAIGDMACHIMDPAFWALKLGEAPTFTCEVLKEEGMNDQTAPKKSVIKYEFPARLGMPAVDVYWYDGGLLPERPAEIPENEQLGEGDNGSLFIGTTGYATTGCYGGGTRILPEARMQDYKKPTPFLPRVPDENPYLNWLGCCKSGEQAVSDFSYAGPLTEVANMGNVALFAGKKLEYDVASMSFTNAPEANKYLTKEYRAGWELPC